MGITFCGCFLMSMRSVQRGLNYRISSCNYIADWTIVMGKISTVGLALATSELATTDLPERSHQPGLDFIFSKTFVWEEKCHSRILPTLGFQSGLFFTTKRLRTQLYRSLLHDYCQLSCNNYSNSFFEIT